MELQLRTRRWIAAGVATLAGGAGLMVMLPASAQSVEEVPGNPTCPEGTTSLKVEPVASGEYSDDVLTVNLTVNQTDQGQTFNWTSNIAVQTVIVKGGPNANVYSYGSPGSTGDSGLHAPVNPENQQYYGLSHVDFCYVPTTPTTEPPTTAPPTTAPPTTAPPTTAPGETTTTQPPPPPPPAPRAPAAAPPAPVVAQPSFTG
jgi:hypothetical protein